MKKVALLLIGLAGSLQCPALAERHPRGAVLELHSCELYAGGCVVSSEATQGGRYMLRAWTLTEGELGGTCLAGLQVALLQTSPDNLAAVGSAPGRGVIYLPEGASAEQRAALVSWVESAAACPERANLQTRIVPLELAAKDGGCQFAAGDYLSVKTVSPGSCPTVACGEALWYVPRTEGTVFTVAVNSSSRVSEPMLKLKWEDSGKKSVFLAKFGENTPARNLYVSSADWCGVGERIF